MTQHLNLTLTRVVFEFDPVGSCVGQKGLI